VTEDPALEIRVHFGDSRCSTFGLEFAQVLGPEQELPVQVGLLDRVEIGHLNATLASRSETHHTPVLQHLATDSSGSNQKFSGFLDLSLELLSKDCNLCIVSRASGRTFILGRNLIRHRFERVKVHVLHHGVELGAASFEHFLSNETSDNSTHGREFSLRLVRQLGKDLLVKLIFKPKLPLDLVGKVDDLLGIVWVSRSREPSVFVNERREGLETNMQSCGSVELGKVGHKVLWLLERLLQGFLLADMAI
jgi:hypothetical protein